MSLLFPKSLSFVLPQMTPCLRFVAGLLKGVLFRLIRPKDNNWRTMAMVDKKFEEDTNGVGSVVLRRAKQHRGSSIHVSTASPQKLHAPNCSWAGWCGLPAYGKKSSVIFMLPRPSF